MTTTEAYKKISVTTNSGGITGKYAFTKYGSDPTKSSEYSHGEEITLVPESGSITAGDYYVCVLPADVDGLSIKCYTDETNYVEKSTNKSYTFVRNTVYDLGTISAPKTDTNLLPGKYSVSATKQVQFTKGNLYWDGSTFHLESTQTAYPSSWSSSHVGHFYWTSATDFASGKSAYMPYNTSYSKSTASNSDKFWCGIDNPLEVDGTSGLYALSQPEWYYLLYTRQNASKLYKCGVSVNGRSYCVVIAPDDYTGTLKSSYTLAQLEAEGLVCFPNTGRRYQTGIQDTHHGYIWTATVGAYRLYFHDSSIAIESGHGRDGSYSIRLVK